MSRSRRKTPIHGFTACASEAKYKRIWHKKFRALARSKSIELTDERLVSDPWCMGKDGKRWWGTSGFPWSPWKDRPYLFWMK